MGYSSLLPAPSDTSFPLGMDAAGRKLEVRLLGALGFDVAVWWGDGGEKPRSGSREEPSEG